MTDAIQVFAGDCTVQFDQGTDRTENRGDVVVVVKPDNTVLVHDADGYQPVAWLTRAEALSYEVDDGFAVTATTDDRVLRVRSNLSRATASYAASRAGSPVGPCPACGGALVAVHGSVECLACDAAYGLPSGAELLDPTCACGLPTMRVAYGASFSLCIDRDCESLDDLVRERFDHEWDCKECGADLRVLRRRGLLLGCDAYPECDTGYAFPNGVVVDECACGLPVFETPTGRRCLDSGCDV